MLSDILQKIQSATDALGELAAAERALLNEHAAACADLDRLRSAPEPADTVARHAYRLIDQTAAEWANQHAGGLVAAFTGKFELDESAGDVWVERRPTLWTNAFQKLTSSISAACCPWR